MPLRTETIRRTIDECPCDFCARPLRVGDRVRVDLDRGTIYCSRACADDDAPVIPLPPAYLRAA